MSNEFRNDRDVVNRRSTTTERPVSYREEDYYNYDERPRQRTTRQGRPAHPGYDNQGRPLRTRDPYAPGPSAQGRRPVQGYAQPGPEYAQQRPRDGYPRQQRPAGRPANAPRRSQAPSQPVYYSVPEDWEKPRRKKSSSGRGGRGGQAPAGKSTAPRRKNPFKKFIKSVLITLLILLVIFLGLSFIMTKKAYSLMTYEEAGDLDKEALTADGVTNILLIGNDSRVGGEDGRSDAMIIVSISSKTGKVLMTSVLRDIYVEIPGCGSNRLNAAYAWGGPELLMKTIEKNFDIPVNRYILVNFEAFANVVDAVGGVDLELSPDEVIWLNAYLNEYNELRGKEFGYDYIYQLEGGMMHLNGAQALAYSRNRYIGMDFGRTERQRKVMEEIIKKLPGTVLKDFNGFVEALCPNLTTNLTFNECYTLLLRAPFALRYERVSGSLPLENTWWNENIDSMAVLGVDFEANKAYLKENLYYAPKKETEENEPVE
ncbi:MAG: LCP family protein [Lachnospiraceae bacterium]|nr:LCP family protein [Lachnospiraceae bacterium]